VSSASRSIVINFRGSIGGLVGSTRRAVSEISRAGAAGVRIGRDLSQTLLHGNIKPIIGDVVGGLTKMARLVFVMPGLLFALVNPMNVASMATFNFSNAISASSPQEFVAATRNMAPAMKDAVMATRLLSPEIKNLYGIIQQGFWLGAADDIRQLADVYFPILGGGLGTISSVLGRLRHDFVEFLLTPEVSATIHEWMTAFGDWLSSMEPFVQTMFPVMLQLLNDFANIMINVVLPIMTRLTMAFASFMNWLTPIITGVSQLVGLSGGVSGGTTGGSSSGGSGILGFLGGLVSGVGSFIGGLFGGGRATGGPVMSGRSYLVGERGAEILTMGANSGFVNPNVHTGDTHVTVKIGEAELRDIVSSEIDRYATGVAISARMGRGFYA
jgi:phage-related protein